MQVIMTEDQYVFNNNIFNVELIKENGKYQVLYICQMCNESYTTSNGAKSHKCPKAKTIQTTQLVDILPVNLKKDESPEFKNAIENLLRFICVSNVPLRALDDEFFRRALFFLNKDFDFPKRTIMTKRLELLANIIREDNYKKLSDQKISLLFDSAKKWSKEYQALIAYTVKGLYLIFLEQTQDNKVNSISPLIIHAIEKFKKYNTTIVAICTDNDNTNKKTFDPDKGIIQKLSNDYFIRQPCAAHTGELAINDMFGKGC